MFTTLRQGLANQSLWAKFSQPPVLVMPYWKDHTHLFLYHLWLLLLQRQSGVVVTENGYPTNLKYLLSGPSQRKFAGPCSMRLQHLAHTSRNTDPTVLSAAAKCCSPSPPPTHMGFLRAKGGLNHLNIPSAWKGRGMRGKEDKRKRNLNYQNFTEQFAVLISD